MYGRAFQYTLIALSVLVGALFSVFFFRELFPEYRIYQKAYVALENLRAEATQTEPAAFQPGIKQIVLTQPNGAPEIIDRCTSCHVALDVEAYSPTRLERDINGTIIRDQDGVPLKVPNEDYVFTLLDNAIKEAHGDSKRLAELEHLRQVEIGEHTVDMRRVLAMHPLIGREERPFQFHSPEEIGCTSCHNGNGRVLTSDKAHGPVFDGMYEPSFEGVEKHFLEHDPENDPPFSRVFNDRPGHALLFQTTPLFVGGLIEANCMQCHLNAKEQKTDILQRTLQIDQKLFQSALERDAQALQSLIFLEQHIAKQGLPATITQLEAMAANPEFSKQTRHRLNEQKIWLERTVKSIPQESQQRTVEQHIEKSLLTLLGTPEVVEAAKSLEGVSFEEKMDASKLQELLKTTQKGQIHHHQEALKRVSDSSNKRLEIDRLTPTYRLGEQEYFWQACYACHRIAGISRGGVGPDLTQEGFAYPWFIKSKIRWPQGLFPASSMPNMHLDHREIEALTTFLLAQKGKRSAVSDIDYKNNIKAWDEGAKQPWESALPSTEIHNLQRGMEIFATEGCAACHRLRGFSSSVGLSSEASLHASWQELQTERDWFTTQFPELVGPSDLPGSLIVERLQENQASIDQHILAHAKEEGMLDTLHNQHPELLISFYSPFAYAMRAKDHSLKGEALQTWKERVQRVLMMYIQEYGLGRLVGPRLNWSGIFRSDAWLMQHFYDPSAMVPRSLMPSLRFDATKFSALTYMLGELSRKNLAKNRLQWNEEGFQPKVAYSLYCSQCHGPSERRDEAPLLQWIYPIPKNLRNHTFLKNLTKSRMIQSILHGVKGTPMPPWGETPQDKAFNNDQPVLNPHEVEQLVDWLLRSLPGDSNLKPVPKWNYTPEDVLKDLQREKDQLRAHEWNPSAWQQEGVFLAALSDPTALSDIAYLGRPEEVKPLTVETLFEERAPLIGTNTKDYYIQARFATPENLAEGQRLFVEHCAVCHGVEGGGDGPRASEMFDAKPRILTNIHWLDTRDDLHLLRVIKYGVPGTSMVAWGDATTMLQRLQLTLYIRHLSSQLKARDELAQALYEAFELPSQQIEVLRGTRFASIPLMESEQRQLHAKRLALETSGKLNLEQETTALKFYQEEQALEIQLDMKRSEDAQFIALMKLLAQEKTLNETMGKFLLNNHVDQRIWQQFLSVVREQEGRYRIEDGKVILSPKETFKEMQDAANQLFATLLSEKQIEAKRLRGQFATPGQRQLLLKLAKATEMLKNVQEEFVSTLFEMQRLHQAEETQLQKLPTGTFEISSPSNQQLKPMDIMQGNQS